MTNIRRGCVGILLFALVAVGSGFLPLIAIAQDANEASAEEELFGGVGTADTPGLQSCFDYYEFGSTPTVLVSELEEVAQGASIAFTGTVENTNAYPLSDVSVYAKVFFLGAAGLSDEKNPNGPEVVDWIRIAEDISLEPQEKKELQFIWQVPENATEGGYRIATFVVSSDRFNMLGLTFTDDIVGGGTDFQVVNTRRAESVRFDKSSVMVNGMQYLFAAYPPRIEASRADVSARIKNPTDEKVDVTVTWELYSWDSLREENRIEKESESLSLAPFEERELTFTTADTDHPVYYLKATAETEGHTDSLLGIRFVRPNAVEPRLNFVGVNAHDGNGPDTIFACAHSVGMGVAENVLIELEAVSRNNDIRSILFGSQTFRSEYNGNLPGDIRALVMNVEALGPSFDVTARLYHNDRVVDEVTQIYRCGTADAVCPLDGGKVLRVLLLALILISVTSIGAYIWKHRQQSYSA